MSGPGDSQDWYGRSRRDVLRAMGAGIAGGSVLSGATAPIPGQTAGEEWSQFGNDTANTGHAADSTGPVDGIEGQWRFGTGDSVQSSPVVADGTVYVGSLDTDLYAVDADTGEEQWRFGTGDWVQSSPVVADGTVYVGSDDTNLYALDAGTEQILEADSDDDMGLLPVVAGLLGIGGAGGLWYARRRSDDEKRDGADPGR